MLLTLLNIFGSLKYNTFMVKVIINVIIINRQNYVSLDFGSCSCLCNGF